MAPDLDLQLTVVIRALKDVVSPAIDSNNKMVAQQLQLSIATLMLVKSGLRWNHRRARKELLNAIQLADALAAITLGRVLLDDATDARSELQDPHSDEPRLDKVRRSLLAETELAVKSAVGSSSWDRVVHAVLFHSKQQLALARAWCLEAGFEPNARDLGSLETLLSEQ